MYLLYLDLLSRGAFAESNVLEIDQSGTYFPRLS